MDYNPLSVLIVDDEASIRSGLSKAIEWNKLGLTVIGTASNGLEAYDAIEKYIPNIVLTDIRMPQCDGLSLIKKVTQKGLPITFIIISGFDDFKYAQQAIKYGVSSYLLKPVNTTALFEELQVLCDKIHTTQKKQSFDSSTKHKLKIGITALREQFFHSLLQNEFHSEAEINNQLEQCNLSFANTSFNTFVFAYDIGSTSDSYVLGKDDLPLFLSSVRNILEELLGNHPSVTFIDMNHNIVALVQTPYAYTQSDDFPTKICSCCIHTVKKLFNINMWVGIGEEANDLLSLQHSYMKAIEHLSYRIYDTTKHIFDNTILSHTAPPQLYAHSINHKPIIDAIYEGSVQNLHTYIDQFFSALFYVEFPPPTFIRGMCVHLIIDVQKGLSAYMPSDKKLFNEKVYTVIYELHSIIQIKQWILDLFTNYISYVNENVSLQQDPVINAAKKYIQSHLFEKITAEDVAAHVHLNEKYFTHYFKEKTTQNFKAYLLQLKLEQAKELLKEGELSIGEIALKLGYSDYRAFNRIFKKLEQLTPSEFQNQYTKRNKGTTHVTKD